MITRHHQNETTASVAVYSPCETYRYSLTRTWDKTGSALMFLMLNPSTATEEKNDPTIERCERRARALGAGSMVIANLFAFRATAPAQLRKAHDPIGPQNDELVSALLSEVDQIIAAWGVHGDHLDRAAQIRGQLAECATPVFHLGLTKHGHPRHPLYLPYAQKPQRWMLTNA